ncbi:MAG: ribosome-associated translation inhibitor RaiA [Phycisphaeraceae bacterium]
MEITVTGRHLEITDPIREYATAKLGKLPKFYNRVQTIELVADMAEHRRYDVEAKVTADRTEPFVSKVHGGDLYACIDECYSKLERQLTDHKEKVRHRKGKTPMAG